MTKMTAKLRGGPNDGLELQGVSGVRLMETMYKEKDEDGKEFWGCAIYERKETAGHTIIYEYSHDGIILL